MKLTQFTKFLLWLPVALAPWWAVDYLTADITVPLSVWLVLHAYIYYAAAQFARNRADGPSDVCWKDVECDCLKCTEAQSK